MHILIIVLPIVFIGLMVAGLMTRSKKTKITLQCGGTAYWIGLYNIFPEFLMGSFSIFLLIVIYNDDPSLLRYEILLGLVGIIAGIGGYVRMLNRVELYESNCVIVNAGRMFSARYDEIRSMQLRGERGSIRAVFSTARLEFQFWDSVNDFKFLVQQICQKSGCSGYKNPN